MTTHLKTASHADLSSVFLINESVFNALTAKQKTDLIIQSGEKKVKFLSDFEGISSKRVLLDRLLEGADTALMIEFQGIELSAEETAAIEAFKPVAKKLAIQANEYSWSNGQASVNLHINDTHVRRERWQLTKATTKKIWDAFTLFNTGGPTPPRLRVRATETGRSWNVADHCVVFNKQGVAIGCQRISKAELDFVARRYRWEAQVFRAE